MSKKKKNRKNKNTKRLNEELCVTIHNEDASDIDSYYTAGRSIAEVINDSQPQIGDRIKIGVYKLVTVNTYEVLFMNAKLVSKK